MSTASRRSMLAALGGVAAGSALTVAAPERAQRALIRTEAELIDALGGVESLAAKLGVTTAYVERWLDRGPSRGSEPGWHLRLYLAALSLGYDVDVAAVFGLDAANIAVLAEGGRHA